MLKNKTKILCKCGCGNEKYLYDSHNRTSDYLRGHYPKTEEHIRKWVKTRKEKGWFKNPEQQRERLSNTLLYQKRIGFWKNKKRSEEDRLKMRLSKLGKTKESSDSLKRASLTRKRLYSLGTIIIWNKGKNHLTEPRLVHGERHYNFKNWKSLEPYGKDFNHILKEDIRKRDFFTCQSCYKTEVELKEKLSVHHIDFNKDNNDSMNLISLCRKCHGDTQKDRSRAMIHYSDVQKLRLGEIQCEINNMSRKRGVTI